MLKQFFNFLFLGVLLLGNVKVYADSTSVQDLKNGLNTVGGDYVLNGEKLSITVDQVKFLNNLDSLKAMGAINPSITQFQANASPVTISSFFGIYISPMILKNIYKNDKDLNNLFVTINLKAPDNYGNESNHELMSFTFTRDLYKKINWKNQDSINFVKIFPNFHTTSWYDQTTSQEPSLFS